MTRPAECTYRKRLITNIAYAAFWEDRGPGSDYAVNLCTCGFSRVAHEPIHPHTGRPGISDHEFAARGPAETDRYYCGCRGWD